MKSFSHLRDSTLVACVLMMLSATAWSQDTATPAPSADKPRHHVFAHYMVCFASYGATVDGYKRDIQDALAAGIDGFALNEGAWDNEPHYPARTKMLFKAAKELRTDFKFIFSLDLATLKPTYIPSIIKGYVNDPAYYRYNGKPVVSTFAGDRGVDWKGIIAPLKAEGYDICFVPFFYPAPVTELPNYDAIKAHFARWSDMVDGMFFFGAAGSDTELTDCNANYVKVARETGKLVMASYTPFYWGANQPGRRFYETHGGAGVERQWRSIIATQPDFVQIVTWNDFSETYLTPIKKPEQYLSSLAHPTRHPHAGYLELSKYFIQWYKTGKEPKIDHDKLVAIYRVHPMASVIPSTSDSASPTPGKPVTSIRQGVVDNIFVTTLLTSPAELCVTTGGVETKFPMEQGYRTISTPFKAGPQHFALYRKGKLVTETDGEPVSDTPTEYNFFPTTAIAVAN